MPDAVTRWRAGVARSIRPQSPLGCHEVNIAEKRLTTIVVKTKKKDMVREMGSKKTTFSSMPGK